MQSHSLYSRLITLFLLALLSLPTVSAQAAEKNKVTSVYRIKSKDLAQSKLDTAIVVGGDFLRLEWANTSAFRPPFLICQVSEDGDTLFEARTDIPSFSVGLKGYASHSSVTVRASNGKKIKVSLLAEPVKNINWVLFVSLGALALLAGALLWLYFRNQRRMLEAKRDELEDVSTRHAHKYESATVLFADIEGFTKISAHMNPDQLIDELDRYFIYFDELVDRYSVEKIKTIGDAYMCAGGVPDADSANPIEVVLVGLEMIAYVQERRATEKGFWNIRVGINTGPVISGHLGNIKKVFDIWGDSVNTASRMESGSEPGRVNISGNTYAKIQDYFECEHRGKMPVKYMGEVDMYFVNRLKDEYCVPGTTCRPNGVLMRKLQILRMADFEQKVKDSLLRGVHPNVAKRLDMFLVRVRTLANMEAFSDDEIITSGVAAIFCFVATEFPKNNLFQGKNTASEFMKKMHLTDDLRERIENAATHVTQGKAPENRVEEVLCDAFNEPFGRKDIIPLLLDNYEDKVARGSHMTRDTWLSKQRAALSGFSFYSESARRLCEVPKAKQLEIIDLTLSV